MTQRSKELLDRVRDAIRLKHYAYRTEKTSGLGETGETPGEGRAHQALAPSGSLRSPSPAVRYEGQHIPTPCGCFVRSDRNGIEFCLMPVTLLPRFANKVMESERVLCLA